MIPDKGEPIVIRLLIIADDFTGGLDTGVQFASRGIPTCVLTDPEEDFSAAAGDCEVLVIVAETRHLPATEAYDAVYRTARKGAELGIGHIYKKTDSALRGNIGAELAAVFQACGAPVLPFIPSLPAMNRITRNGIQYIDGVPVAQSVFGKDPFEPVKESDVTRLISLQTDLPVGKAPADQVSRCKGIAVIDSASEEDLRQAGLSLGRIENLRVSAGCAGFASVLPDLLHLSSRGIPELPVLDRGLFVLCGSVNPITQRQLDYGEKHGFVRTHIAPEVKLHPEIFRSEEGRAILSGWKKQMASENWMILDANDTDPRNMETAVRAAEEGLSIEDVRQRISESLGIILSELADTPAERTLLITGGDTLLKSMNRMKVFRMMPLTEVFPGVVLSRVILCGRSRFVITKSGGFGEETLLSDVKRLISEKK
jgi:uncharacterized protein YgbK (DUF1537 family)